MVQKFAQAENFAKSCHTEQIKRCTLRKTRPESMTITKAMAQLRFDNKNKRIKA